MYDSHIHSWNSPDSVQSVDEVCLQAIEKGMSGVTFTDHAHLLRMEELDIANRIRKSVEDIRVAQETYRGRLEVYCGVELDEVHRAPEAAKQILELADYDVVLGSIHNPEGNQWGKPYAKVIFDETVSEEEIDGYMNCYYRDMFALTEVGGFDVLSHLTCPLRYINSRYERGIDPMLHRDEIAELLKIVIRKDMALEVNTPTTVKYDTIPEREILRMYRDFGGKLLTLGSDSHRNNNVGARFAEAKEILREIGFNCYHYYRGHVPVAVKL